MDTLKVDYVFDLLLCHAIIKNDVQSHFVYWWRFRKCYCIPVFVLTITVVGVLPAHNE